MIQCSRCYQFLAATHFSGPTENCYRCQAPLPDEIKKALEDQKEQTGKTAEEAHRELVERAERPVEVLFGKPLTTLAWISILAAIGFVIAGLYRMYAYTYDDRIVGGDAYNYTILATRGVGLICAGIIFAIIACAFILFSIDRRLKGD